VDETVVTTACYFGSLPVQVMEINLNIRTGIVPNTEARCLLEVAEREI